MPSCPILTLRSPRSATSLLHLQAAAKLAKTAAATSSVEYVIKCADVVNAEIFDLPAFEQYLQAHIKAKKGGRAGDLGANVTLASTETDLTLSSKSAMSKRYVKYLTKKFLKKNLLRDHCRVIATGKTSYAIKPYKAAASTEAAEEETA